MHKHAKAHMLEHYSRVMRRRLALRRASPAVLLESLAMTLTRGEVLSGEVVRLAPRTWSNASAERGPRHNDAAARVVLASPRGLFVRWLAISRKR